MHVHLPKPMHGWRALAGEVGIIVIGVLIALGAEQAVQTVHSRAEAAEFRDAANQELSADLAAYRYRLQQEDCVARRLSDLERWQDLGASQRPRLGVIGRPSVTSYRTSVWKAGADVISHLPLQTRLDYSRLYDIFENLSATTDAEKDVWRSLAAFNGAQSVDANGRMRLTELLYRANSLDWVLRANWKQAKEAGAALGAHPSFGRSAPYIPPPDPAFCAPIVQLAS